jgi:hypothetical protein
MDDLFVQAGDLPTWHQRCALRVLTCSAGACATALPGPRGIAVVYPHTSNWDFMVGLFGKWALNLPFRWLAKDSLFRGRWAAGSALGGEPVDRSAPQGMIRARPNA